MLLHAELETWQGTLEGAVVVVLPPAFFSAALNFPQASHARVNGRAWCGRVYMVLMFGVGGKQGSKLLSQGI